MAESGSSKAGVVSSTLTVPLLRVCVVLGLAWFVGSTGTSVRLSRMSTVQVPWTEQAVRWWDFAGACSGRPRSRAGWTIREFATPSFVIGSGPELAGFTDVYAHRIYLAHGEDTTTTLIHEFIHAHGVYGHPKAVFEDQCGGV